MEMHKVPATSLSVIFDTDINVERIPEPFRLQPDLVLSIPYSEYLLYVHSLSRDSEINMYPSTKDVLEQIHPQSIKSYRGYLLNVAFAICKELHFATVYNLPPTIYLPSSDRGNPIPWKNYVIKTQRVWQDDPRLWDVFDEYEMQFKPTSQNSVLLWNLATCIFKVVDNFSTEGALNLTL